MDNAPWLVTGGNGFLGRRMVEMLVEQNIGVVSFDIVHTGEKFSTVKYVTGDLRKAEDCRKATESCSAVIHVASLTELHGAKSLFDDINVKGTQNLVEAAKGNGVKAFVYTSTSSVVYEGKDIENGDESLPYAKNFIDYYTETKARAEKLVLEANCKQMGTCAIRPHSIYGPGDRHYFPKVLRQAAKGKLKFRLGSGEPLSSYTFVDNCVHAHVIAAKKLAKDSSSVGGQAFFVNDGKPRPFWGVMKEVAVGAGYDGSKIGIKSIPFGVAHTLGGMNEGLHTIAKGLGLGVGDVVFSRFSVLMSCTHHYYSTAKAEKQLGYSPLVDSETAMKRTFAWFKTAGLTKEELKPPPRDWFRVWMFFVAFASVFGSIQGFFFPSVLKTKQFSLTPEMVSPITQRLFGVWTLLAACLRLQCACDTTNVAIFRCTKVSFLIALGFYVNEVCGRAGDFLDLPLWHCSGAGMCTLVGC
eukprot:TRINITY_DN58594_c0_g1_i2.p1 TRINITY_DN58594_c0_g1~~TRINITY_DN58594_c0_g1_i2.p1  ORF type:complete len:469 (+),score=21.24 TRINITY_DN58594_c0_g1_i2:29-1435(+)